MKNKLTITTILFLSTVFLFSCEQQFGPANIRVENVSDFDFKRILIRSGGQELFFGNINSRQISSYKTFAQAYRAAYVELMIDDQKFIFQPIDFVGSESLRAGEYTYRISIADFNRKRLDLEFIKD